MRSVSTTVSKKGITALLAVVAAPAAVEAAPYLHVSLVGRVQGSGQPFSPSVSVIPGDVVEYELRALLGVEGAVNTNAGPTPTSSTTTITNWIPSNGATSPTAGLNSVRFNVDQNSTTGDIRVDFDAPTTAAPGWADNAGASGGTLNPGVDGNDTLKNIFLIRAPGNMAGIGPDEQPQLITIASGVFDITSGGSPASVSPNIAGYDTPTAVAAIRWRNAANTTNVNYTATAFQQSNSTDPGNPDPIIIYNGLALLPEPTTAGAAALAVVSLVRRRRRVAK